MFNSLLQKNPDQNIFRRGKFQFLSSLIEKTTFLILYLYIAKNFTRHEFGLVVLSFTFFNILSSFSDLGLPAYCQREAARIETMGNKLAGLLKIKVILLIPFLLTGLILRREDLAYSGLIIVAGLFVYISSVNDIFVKYLYGKNKFGLAFSLLFYSRLIFYFSILFALILNIRYDLLIAVLAISSIINLIFLLNQSSIKSAGVSGDLGYYDLKNILKSSLPLWLGSIFVWCYNKLDLLLIQAFLGTASVAYYAAAYSIYQFPQILFGLVLSPLYTDLSAQYGKREICSYHEIIKKNSMMFFIIFSLVLIYLISPGRIITIIFGSGYSNTGPVLRILSLALIPLFLNNITGIILNSAGREKLQMAGTFTGLIINLVLNLFLLPKISIIASAIATVATESVVFTIQLYYIIKKKLIAYK